MSLSSLEASASAGGNLGVDSISFDTDDLDRSIEESGLCAELELDKATQRQLAASAMVLCSVAITAKTEREFDDALVELSDEIGGEIGAPKSLLEHTFLFGFAEHIKQDLVQAFGSADEVVPLRYLLSARLARSRAVLQAQYL